MHTRPIFEPDTQVDQTNYYWFEKGFSFEEVVIGTYTLDSINQEKKSLYVTMSAQGQRAFLTVAFQTKDTAVFDLMGKKEIFCRQLPVQ